MSPLQRIFVRELGRVGIVQHELVDRSASPRDARPQQIIRLRALAIVKKASKNGAHRVCDPYLEMLVGSDEIAIFCEKLVEIEVALAVIFFQKGVPTLSPLVEDG